MCRNLETCSGSSSIVSYLSFEELLYQKKVFMFFLLKFIFLTDDRPLTQLFSVAYLESRLSTAAEIGITNDYEII